MKISSGLYFAPCSVVFSARPPGVGCAVTEQCLVARPSEPPEWHQASRGWCPASANQRPELRRADQSEAGIGCGPTIMCPAAWQWQGYSMLLISDLTGLFYYSEKVGGKGGRKEMMESSTLCLYSTHLIHIYVDYREYYWFELVKKKLRTLLPIERFICFECDFLTINQ